MSMNEEEFLKNLFYKPEICSKCKGLCCQRCSCNCSPLNFDKNVTKMEKALETGYYSIDFVRYTARSFYQKDGYIYLDINQILSNNMEVLYIRARNQSRPIVDIIHESDEEGPCVFWSYEKGCALSYEDRPMYGRMMIPNEDPMLCCSYFDVVGDFRTQFCNDWKPFTKDLFKLAQKFFETNWYLYQEYGIRI